MYAWATPQYLLDEMSLDQWRLYYNYGWEARQTEYRVNWAILGQLLNGEDPDKKVKNFRKEHPEGKDENGTWTVSR